MKNRIIALALAGLMMWAPVMGEEAESWTEPVAPAKEETGYPAEPASSEAETGTNAAEPADPETEMEINPAEERMVSGPAAQETGSEETEELPAEEAPAASGEATEGTESLADLLDLSQGEVFIFPVNGQESRSEETAQEELPEAEPETSRPEETAPEELPEAETETSRSEETAEAEPEAPRLEESALEEAPEAEPEMAPSENVSETLGDSEPIDAPATEENSEEATEDISGEEDTETSLQGVNDASGQTDAGEVVTALPEINDLELDKLDTNAEYSRLSFGFTLDGQEYSCLVTGLRETAENALSACRSLAEAIASSFQAGEVFTLSSETALEKYGLNLDLIDAEKASVLFGSEDRAVCWAASAADMLEYAGWNRDEDADEDAIFDDFRENFDNRGGYQSWGISWYLDGVNPGQLTYKSGNMTYDQGKTGTAAQQKTAGTGGYWTEYAAAEAAPETGYYDEIPTQLEEALDGLAEGGAVGVGAYYYDQNNRTSGGHALTVFGYIRQKLSQAAEILRALFISDSDNRARGEAVGTDPASRPNEYSMYTVSEYENGDIASLQLDNYDQTSLTTVVGLVSTLQAKSETVPEQSGTRDAGSSPNLVALDVKLSDEEGVALKQAEAGVRVTVETDFENRAYRAIPANAQLRYRINVYRDGQLAARQEQSVTLDRVNPNKSFSASASLQLEEAGEYRFETEILEILDGQGQPIQEAYVNDNLYRGAARILTVQGEKASEAQADPANHPADDRTSDPADLPFRDPEAVATAAIREEEQRQTEKIWQLTVDLSAENAEYVLDFGAPLREASAFRSLINRGSGAEVDPSAYRISGEDSSFTLSFTEDFIRHLRPGHNDFSLKYDTGRLLIRITIL